MRPRPSTVHEHGDSPCLAMERLDRLQRTTAPSSSDSDPWRRRIEKRAALIRRRPAKRFKARQRHRIAKTTLVDALFNFLDTHNFGALGRDEFNQFALLAGFQRDREELYGEISILLDTWIHACTPVLFQEDQGIKPEEE